MFRKDLSSSIDLLRENNTSVVVVNFLYPGGDPDQSENLMGSKLDQNQCFSGRYNQ